MIDNVLVKFTPVSASPLLFRPRRASSRFAKISASTKAEAMGIAAALALSVSFAIFALAF